MSKVVPVHVRHASGSPGRDIAARDCDLVDGDGLIIRVKGRASLQQRRDPIDKRERERSTVWSESEADNAAQSAAG